MAGEADRRDPAERPPIQTRVAELLARIREGAVTDRSRKAADVNEEKVDEFILAVEAHPRHDRVRILRQEIPWTARRTTRWNYVFEVAGRRPDKLLLVAHYDTWGGPGADDNTTGEEILKQYLRLDLEATAPPEFTRVYFLAGSEECGLVGFLSQLLFTGLLWAASIAYMTGDLAASLIAVALSPILLYRFGVAGSRHYVRSLPREELEKIRGVISVDSVGEGRLYIPTTTLGADIVRAVFPYAGHDDLDDLLKEIAHLRGISYNTCLAGGTTDHLSFLQVNRSLPRTLLEMARWLRCRLAARPYKAPFFIPASALIAMCPGKASAFILGGKIHTPNDTADRVYPEPLGETLAILDDFFDRFEKGSRPLKPREARDCHYARLYRLSDGRAVVALKDAVEPNRRNLNLLCAGEFEPESGKFDVGETLDWGNETRLDREMAEFAARAGLRFRRLRVPRLLVCDNGAHVAFERSPAPLRRAASGILGATQDLLGRFSFLTMFAAAVGLAHVCTWLLVDTPIRRGWWPDGLPGAGPVLTTVSLAAQLAILFRFMGRWLPTWIDNAYKNLNHADNLGSLKARTPIVESDMRTSAGPDRARVPSPAK